MKHKTIVTRLCYFLSEGYGINQALSLEGLTTTYLTERIRRIDRVRLHQAHSIYREGLQREIVQRARLGRDITRLERALNNLPPLSLPGDDEDEERAHRKGRRRSNRARPEDRVIFLGNSPIADVENDEDEDDKDDATETVSSPAAEATPAPRNRSQTSDTPLVLENPYPAEEPYQRRPEAPVAQPEPEPEPELVWVRLFTGRAVGRNADGKIIESLLPGTPGYPHESEFVNWN